jgi:hypothetical protein
VGEKRGKAHTTKTRSSMLRYLNTAINKQKQPQSINQKWGAQVVGPYLRPSESGSRTYQGRYLMKEVIGHTVADVEGGGRVLLAVIFLDVFFFGVVGAGFHSVD